jgi:hypothetical protein
MFLLRSLSAIYYYYLLNLFSKRRYLQIHYVHGSVWSWVQVLPEATTSSKRLEFFRLIRSHFQDFQIFTVNFQIFQLHSATSFRK